MSTVDAPFEGELIRTRARWLIVAAVSVAASLGVPAQAQADARAPRTLDTSIALASRIDPGAAFRRIVALPWRANLVGVSFAGDAADDVEVRVRASRGGVWSSWQELEFHDEDAPDGAERAQASPRRATGPAWIGTSDRVEVAIAGEEPMHGVRLHVLNTLGDPRPEHIVLRWARAIGSFLSMQPAPAEAMTSTPAIIRRARWGADERWRRAAPSYAPEVKMTWIHHTDNSNSYSKSQSAALIRGIYRYHVFTRGFNDIGYNFLVDRYGQVFEGRHGGVTEPVIGAHTMGFNTASTGIALLGNFDRARPPSAMLRSLQRLVAWKMDTHHAPPTGTVLMHSYGNPRYGAGRVVRFNRVSGHRDGYPTACPGSAGYGRLPWLRSAANGIGHPKIYLPRGSAPVLRPDGDGVEDAWRFTASFSRTVAWTLTIADPAGATKRTWSSSGTTVGSGVLWRGDDVTGALLPTGTYTWRLTARDGAGAIARFARGSVILVNGHPDGTLLSDDSGRYVVHAGLAAEVPHIPWVSNFGWLPPVVTGPGERARAQAGTPLGLRAGTLFRVAGADATTRYIWDGVALRRFAAVPESGVDTFAALGYRDEATLGVDDAFIAGIAPHGADVTEANVHPAGSIVRDPASGEMFVMESGGRRPIPLAAQRTRYRDAEVVQALPGDLDPTMPILAPVTARDGALLADPGEGEPWVVAGGERRRFASWSLFTAMGYTTRMLTKLPAEALASLPEGPRFG